MLKELITTGEDLTMRWFKTAGGLLIIMLLMASCIRIDAKITIEDDGSGSVDFLSALNTDALTEVLGDFDVPESEIGDTAELCEGFESEFSNPSELPDGALVTPYNEDGFCGSRVQYELTPSTDPSNQIADLIDPSTRIYKEGDNWFFETAIDTDELTSEASDAPQAMFDALFADASYMITVDLPGRAVDGQNNATSVGDDGKFTWDIDIANPPERLFAQTEPGSGGGSGGGGGLSPILIGVIAALLAGGLAFFLWKRKNDGASPDAAMVDSLHQPGAAMSPPGAATPPGAAATLPGAPAAMPVAGGPAISATPPSPAGLPVVPDDAVKETVVMNAADIQQSIQDAAADTGASAVTAEPVFDEALNAWVIDDPQRGRLRHDPATDSWNPI